MKNKVVKFLLVVSLVILNMLPNLIVKAEKYKINVKLELDKTRIRLTEINTRKPLNKLVFWSDVVSDKDILIWNDKIINIPKNGRIVKAIKKVDRLAKVPTSYIEDHYYETLEKEERYYKAVYKLLRSHRELKKFLNNSPN